MLSILRWGLGLSYLGVAASCGDQDEPPLRLPEISWSSEDFDFAADPGLDTLCGGTLEFQQRFVDLLQEIVGEPMGSEKFTYYLLNYVDFLEVFGEQWDGVYDDARVFASVIPHHHEVTHAVVDLAIGSSHPFFNEGIAEVFHDRYGDNRGPTTLDIEDGLQYDGVHEMLPSGLYGRAGHFMSYVLDVHGAEAAVELLALARLGDPPEVLRDIIAAATGIAYEDILADYAAYPSCSHDQFHWPIAECEVGARIEPSGRIWSIDADLDCKRADVLGTRVTEDWTYRTIEVEVAGRYRIVVPGGEEDYALVEIGHCSPGCAPDKGVEVQVRESRTVDLRPGRYHVTLVAQFVKSGRLQVRIEPVDIGAWSRAD